LSQHAGDAYARTGETIVNLRTVMAEAHRHGLIDATAATERLFKVYLRRPEFRPVVEARARKAFGPEPSIVYLHSRNPPPGLVAGDRACVFDKIEVLKIHRAWHR
jgi:hypothetical protein